MVVFGVVRTLCASVRLGTPFTALLIYCTVLLLHFPVSLPLRLCVQVVCTRLCASIPTQPLFQTIRGCARRVAQRVSLIEFAHFCVAQRSGGCVGFFGVGFVSIPYSSLM